LPTAETPESQEVCFVADTNNKFLKKYLKTKPGPVIEQAQNGIKKIIGRHNGLWFYTIGQRKGLEVPQGPWYVVGKDFKNNNLVVSKNKKDLLKKELIAKNVNWISGKAPKLPLKVKVKIRYRANLCSATLLKIKNLKLKILFDAGQKAVTPGQSAVFYKDKELLGGGVIE
jgi:tRNA-uridine 2-sulfurtransferase